MDFTDIRTRRRAFLTALTVDFFAVGYLALVTMFGGCA